MNVFDWLLMPAVETLIFTVRIDISARTSFSSLLVVNGVMNQFLFLMLQNQVFLITTPPPPKKAHKIPKGIWVTPAFCHPCSLTLSHSHTHTMKGDWVGVLEGSPRIWSLKASIRKHKIPPHVNKTLSWERRKQEAFLFLLLSCMPKAVRTCSTHILSFLSPTLQQGSLACYDVTQVCWWCKSAILWRYWSNYATLWHGQNTPWDTKLRHQNKKNPTFLATWQSCVNRADTH